MKTNLTQNSKEVTYNTEVGDSAGYIKPEWLKEADELWKKINSQMSNQYP